MTQETIDLTTPEGKAALKRAQGGMVLENRKVTKSDREKLEDAFLAAWRVVAKDLPEPIPQYKFHPVRKWRFDFVFHAAHLDFALSEQHIKLAVEIQGGGFVKGGHVRGAQQEKDFEKLRAAARLGWIVLQYGSKAMGDPLKVAAEVAETLREKITTSQRSGE